MAEKILMLALTPTMEIGAISKWNKKEGDTIVSGDVLCEVETDKATMDYECDTEGTLLKVLAAKGGKVHIGEPIAIIGNPGEDIADILKEAEEHTEASKNARQEHKEDKKPVKEPELPLRKEPASYQDRPAGAYSSSDKIKASPIAKKMAREKGIPLGLVRPSGPQGRIIKSDVEDAIEKGITVTGMAPRTLGEERIPVSMKRRAIAQILSGSKYSAPHYYLKVDVRVDELLRVRQGINKKRENKISMNAFFIKLVSEALKRNPMVNSTWEGETILKHGRIDIALAVAQPDGLITPIVRNCESKGIAAIDAELKDLIKKAQSNKLDVEEYSNSTFTITNLGSFGIDEFTAIINPPNVAILAIGAIKKVPALDDNNKISVESNMALTLSCDHRIVDGVIGSAFLKDLKESIEFLIQGLL